jgi:hypothetical protein
MGSVLSFLIERLILDAYSYLDYLWMVVLLFDSSFSLNYSFGSPLEGTLERLAP